MTIDVVARAFYRLVNQRWTGRGNGVRVRARDVQEVICKQTDLYNETLCRSRSWIVFTELQRLMNVLCRLCTVLVICDNRPRVRTREYFIKLDCINLIKSLDEDDFVKLIKSFMS